MASEGVPPSRGEHLVGHDEWGGTASTISSRSSSHNQENRSARRRCRHEPWSSSDWPRLCLLTVQMAFRRRNSLVVSVSLLLIAAWLPCHRGYCAGCTSWPATGRSAPGETSLAEQGGCHKGQVVAVSSGALTTAGIARVPGDCCGSISPSALSAVLATDGTTMAQALASTVVPRDFPTTATGVSYPLGQRRSHSPPLYLSLRSLRI